MVSQRIARDPLQASISMNWHNSPPSYIKQEGEMMNKEQCETVMDIFNSSIPLTSHQVQVLRPILTVVMGVALEGVRRVIEYTWSSKRLVLPQTLRDRNRAVYLRLTTFTKISNEG